MNKDFLAIFILSVVSAFTINYFFRPSPSVKDQVAVAGAGYTLPRIEDLSRPANRTVKLDADETRALSTKTVVSRDSGTLTFSSNGGSITCSNLPRYKNSAGESVNGMFEATPRAAHEQLFFVALDENTPYVYQKDSEGDVDNGYQVVYSARTNEWDITKTFVVEKATNRVSLSLNLQPRVSNPTPLRPRVLMPAPMMEGVPKNAAHAMVSKDGNAGIIESTGSQVNEQAWVMPSFFGTTDTYLAHMLVRDSEHFTQRGYFMGGGNGPSTLTAVLEGPALTSERSFDLSFYVGPKEYGSLLAVDTQLQDLVFSGWFSFFSKWMLELLLLLFSYLQNFGFAIMALTILLNLFFLPLMLRARRESALHQKIQRSVGYLRSKYGNDPQRLEQEMRALYAQHGTGPGGMAFGCLAPMLQIPIFFTFYRVLGNAAELYQAPFIGWIRDLSLRDPYHLLPAIAALLIFNQPLMPMGDNKSQTMSYIFPLIMVGLVFSVPAGLQLYLCINMSFTLIQNILRPAHTA